MKELALGNYVISLKSSYQGYLVAFDMCDNSAKIEDSFGIYRDVKLSDLYKIDPKIVAYKNISWMSDEQCKECLYPVVMTQCNHETNPHDDYRWYCSNPDCVNHDNKTCTGDMERPDWLLNIKEYIIDKE